MKIRVIAALALMGLTAFPAVAAQRLVLLENFTNVG